MNAAISRTLAKAVSETPKWDASAAGLCGRMTAQAPSPACRKSMKTITGTRIFTSLRCRQPMRATVPSARIRTVSILVTKRWLNSIKVETAMLGMNLPLQRGHDLPQPACEPVLVTVAPIISTTSIPTVAATASQRASRVNLGSDAVIVCSRSSVTPVKMLVASAETTGSEKCTRSFRTPRQEESSIQGRNNADMGDEDAARR